MSTDILANYDLLYKDIDREDKPIKPQPAAYMVEGLDKGKLYARKIHFTLEEARKTAAAFSQHYSTVNIRELIYAD